MSIPTPTLTWEQTREWLPLALRKVSDEGEATALCDNARFRYLRYVAKLEARGERIENHAGLFLKQLRWQLATYRKNEALRADRIRQYMLTPTSAEERVDGLELEELMMVCETLEPSQREVIRQYLEGCTVSEIGQTSSSRSTGYRRLRDVLAEIREKLLAD